jgi:O-glycosyl hydrolase
MKLLCLLLCLFCIFTAGFSGEGEILKINIDTSVEYQTMDGFGASDAWRCQFVGKNWPLEKRDYIADLLFSQKFDDKGNPKGIGLSLWRFYISAGTTEQGDDSNIGNPWRRGECFQNTDGAYDWSKMTGQQWFLDAAKKRGIERLLAFPNSPPVHMTRNEKGYAEKGVVRLNLKPGKMQNYASFLVDVIEHFDNKGIHFDHLSPINEPQWNWDGTGQEGTPALNEEIYSLVKYLSYDLSQRKLSTNIIVGEAGTIGHAAIDMSTVGMQSDGRDDQARFFFNPDSPFYIGDLPNVEKTISAHSYHSVWPLKKQVKYRHAVQQALQAANSELGYWMSEYCILQNNGEIISGSGRDLGMPTALYVARIIHNDLTITNAKSWQWWTAISQVDFKDGLVYLDDGSRSDSGKMGGNVPSLQNDGVVRESKLLWVLGNYSRFIRPGAVRVKCGVEPVQSIAAGLLASAYKITDGKLAVVMVNLSTKERQCGLDMSHKVDVYTTSSTTNLERSRQDASNILIPGRAVATVLLSDN